MVHSAQTRCVRNGRNVRLSERVQLALSVRLAEFEKTIRTHAAKGHTGAIKALSLFLPLRPLLIRELRGLQDNDAAELIRQVRLFLDDVDQTV